MTSENGHEILLSNVILIPMKNVINSTQNITKTIINFHVPMYNFQVQILENTKFISDDLILWTEE